MMTGVAKTPLLPNLQIPHWEWDLSETDAPLPLFPVNALSTKTTNNVNVTEDFDMPVDAFSDDHFRMFEFKIRSCVRGRSHDWTECPYAHPAEKARRRDPRRFHYSAAPCPEFRRGSFCNKGDACQFAHGVFECWLHPARYRTQLCKDGTTCRRRVCFFAHTPAQLRQVIVTRGSDKSSSPIRHAFGDSFVSSPTSVLNSLFSDHSPSLSPQHRFGSFNGVSVSEIVRSMRDVQLDDNVSSTRGAFGSGFLRSWWDQQYYEEEGAMERVESGRELRAKLYAKLSRENSSSAPDFGWVSELLK